MADKANTKKGARKLKATGMRNGTQNEKKCAAYRQRESNGNTRKMRAIARRIKWLGPKKSGVGNHYLLTEKGRAMRRSS